MRDFTELDRQIDNAEAHELDAAAPGREWDQTIWVASSGTYGCLAGNAVLDAGLHANISGVILDLDGVPMFTRDGFWLEVQHVAAGILGLDDEEEAKAFFDGQNNAAVLRRLQKDLHDGLDVNHDLAVEYQYEEGCMEG
jgi:hypothetical protein